MAPSGSLRRDEVAALAKARAQPLRTWRRVVSVGSAVLVVACAQGEEAVPISGSAIDVGPATYEVVVGCYDSVRVEVSEQPEVVELRGYGKGKIDGDCASTAIVQLDAPLGDRRLVDGETGRTLSVAEPSD